MQQIAEEIRPGMSEADIALRTEAMLLQNGADSFWYHGVGALVLSGPERSLASVSGRTYRPSADIFLTDNDMITLDLSPQVGSAWGDYARTIFIENGRGILEPSAPAYPVFLKGYEEELLLHKELMSFASPSTTFHQVWEHMNHYLSSLGLTNLDFHGNLGHTIEDHPDKRRYLEEGNHLTLGETHLPFTFEPHISREGQPYGFKRENIYYFDESGVLREL